MIKYTPVFMESPEIPKSIATEPISLWNEDSGIQFGLESETVKDDIGYTPVSQPENIPDLSYARETLSNRSSKTKHRFAGDSMDVGKMNEFLDKAESCGVTFKVTSGVRQNAKTSSGNISRHAEGLAIDIVPLDGETWDDLINKFKNSPELIQYMVDNNVGFLTEITKEEQEKYGATGANIHISMPGETRNYGEKNAIDSRRRVLGA